MKNHKLLEPLVAPGGAGVSSRHPAPRPSSGHQAGEQFRGKAGEVNREIAAGNRDRQAQVSHHTAQQGCHVECRVGAQQAREIRRDRCDAAERRQQVLVQVHVEGWHGAPVTPGMSRSRLSVLGKSPSRVLSGILMSELPAAPKSDSRVLTDKLMSWLPALPRSVSGHVERVMSLLPEVPSSPSRVAVETLMSWLPECREATRGR